MTSKKILKEYIQEVISEDVGTDWGGPYGPMLANNDQMYKTFIKPFADVFGVASGKTKQLSQKAQTVGKVAFETIATTLFPFLSSDYKQIFDKEKQAIDKIKSDYNEVYAATWDAFRNKDIAFLAMMYSPATVLGYKLFSKSTETSCNFLSAISGGELDGFLEKAKSKYLAKSRKSEGALLEDDENQSQNKFAKVLSDKRVISKAIDSPTAQRMSADAQKIVRETLSNAYNHAQKVLNAKSVQDIQSVTGKNIPGLDKLKQIPEQERQAFETQLLTTLKKSMKEFYIKALENNVKDAMNSGIPQDSAFVKDYANVISKIKSL
jgi:hypothetical protein